MRPLLVTLFLLLTATAFAQHADKVFYTDKDYYLAVKPAGENNHGVLVLLRSFSDPEYISKETNLPNVAAANGLLTILVSAGQKLYADTAMVHQLNQVLRHVIQQYKPDTSRFALGAYDFAGTIVLRYAEMAKAGLMDIPVVPKAVFTADSPTDLFSFWERQEATIRKNFNAGSVGDAKWLLGHMKEEHGDIHSHAANYATLTPFRNNVAGNEQYLKDMYVRLYFDTDIEWQLANRRNSYFDTNMPDGAELIKRLLLAGNDNAAFISTRPGMRPNGVRSPSAFSIIEETDCISWIKQSFGIFDPNKWVRPYKVNVPADWGREVTNYPPDFAPTLEGKGVEDLYFTPGWGKQGADEYWTYAYSLLLEGQQVPDIKTMLTAYYEGLVKRNNSDAPVVVKTKDSKTGTISMFDYMAKQPMVLNFAVSKKECGDKVLLFIKISPKSADHPVWKRLHEMDASIRCY